MPKKLRPFYNEALEISDDLFRKGDLHKSWKYLERAHIFGQPYPMEHTKAHVKMLIFGLKTKDAKEVIGQIPRLLFGGVKSFVGTIPNGNTGGANVPPLKSMKIPDDIQKIIDANTP